MDLPASIIAQNSKFNCETNTGHIYKVKHSPESWNLQVSNEPKNINIGEELVEK